MDRHEVAALFGKLGADTDGFFARVADDVDWTVMGTHPLAGHYRTRQHLVDHTFAKLALVLTGGAQLRIEHVLVDGDWAVVELRSQAVAENGMRFDNRYCWLCRFDSGMIVEVRAYLDSAMVARLFRENPIAWWEPRSDRPSSNIVDE